MNDIFMDFCLLYGIISLVFDTISLFKRIIKNITQW